MEDLYIKKYWDEENIMYYFHVHNDVVVRQIEIQDGEKNCSDIAHSLQDNASIADICFSEMEIDNPAYVTRQEFDSVWNGTSNIVLIPQGDLFRLEHATSYAHGCNCKGAMGKGIALQFRERFPEMYKEYKALCKEGKFRPGDLFVYPYGHGFVYNLATQKTWHDKATLQAIEKSLMQMLEHAMRNDVKSIALPRIGAGLGGLNWEDVKSVIQKVSSIYPMVTLLVVEAYMPFAENGEL